MSSDTFDLQPPDSEDDNSEDSLGDQSTNDAIAIELKEETNDRVRIL